ncbi:hypothetical protein [Paracoccus aestuariivivens]|uniref:Uncharacterized protein n=1 Tax=Paracoccus aestuariivivens TaxID=1820333 RepID=A0A6L6JHP8_9RHOB|nr:hypothetical protein [Paracoccus aestuariivivens]MTH80077.1 hypothetical protein [Paracoccus aestuariivivens]
MELAYRSHQRSRRDHVNCCGVAQGLYSLAGKGLSFFTAREEHFGMLASGPSAHFTTYSDHSAFFFLPGASNSVLFIGANAWPVQIQAQICRAAQEVRTIPCQIQHHALPRSLSKHHLDRQHDVRLAVGRRQAVDLVS